MLRCWYSAYGILLSIVDTGRQTVAEDRLGGSTSRLVTSVKLLSNTCTVPILVISLTRTCMKKHTVVMQECDTLRSQYYNRYRSRNNLCLQCVCDAMRLQGVYQSATAAV